MQIFRKFFLVLSHCVPDSFYFRFVRNFFLKLAGVNLRIWGCYIKRPYYFDNPSNITIGNGVFINSGVCFEGEGKITIGSQCQVAPYVVFATTNHEFPNWDEKVEPVMIGNRVWIGAHVTVTPGAIVNSDTVIGAGAVVTGKIGGGLFAGIPAKKIKGD